MFFYWLHVITWLRPYMISDDAAEVVIELTRKGYLTPNAFYTALHLNAKSIT